MILCSLAGIKIDVHEYLVMSYLLIYDKITQYLKNY